QGYEPLLGNLLGAQVANAGVSGTTSSDGAASISVTLSAHPTATHYLVMYGSNDAFVPAVPIGSYKDSMQRIVSAIVAAGKTPCLAKVPYASNPDLDDAAIRGYNEAVDELVAANGIACASPDFYSWFISHPGQLADGLHPNGTGYQSMATLWNAVLPQAR
ncbi:MAG: SGNH/GDSL hydrolase family protein, partial [Deltaproteobacteria bacterium]